MSLQDITPHNIEVTDGDQLEEDELWVIDSIFTANATPPPSSTPRIHRVPRMMRESGEYEKYYVPKVVSIGPHHFGNKDLELVEKLKPVFTTRLLSNKETLRSLYRRLGAPEMVQQLRSFYEENATIEFCNRDFTKIMLQDSCFILYYIQYIFGGNAEDCQELKSHQMAFVHQDLFLLENQIPFKVLTEGMKLIECNWLKKIKWFIYDNFLIYNKPKRKWLEALRGIHNGPSVGEREMNLTRDNEPDHLLHLLHRTLTKDEFPMTIRVADYRLSFRNVNELMDVGIHFKPSDTNSLIHIKFSRGGFWGFSAYVELPPITVDDFTKPMLLNLIAYEACSHDLDVAWVTSYVCLLDTLIGHPEDVEVLRKAEILENCFGRDQEVVKLFNEIASGLVPSNFAYLEAKLKIQKHYESWRYTLTSRLKHEYVKNPCAFFSYFGVLALFLSGVQTYFTIWSPKSTCDDLCMFLKGNHHL